MRSIHARRANTAFLILCVALVGLFVFACSDDEGATDPNPRPVTPDLGMEGLVAERAALDALEQINTLLANVPEWTEGAFGTTKNGVFSPADAEFVDGWWLWQDDLLFGDGRLQLAVAVQLLADGVPRRDVEGADELVAQMEWILDLDQMVGEDHFVLHSVNELHFSVDGLPTGPFNMVADGTIGDEEDKSFITIEVDGISTTYEYDGSWDLGLTLANLDDCPSGSFSATVNAGVVGAIQGPYELVADYDGQAELNWSLSLAGELLDTGSTELLGCTPAE